MGDFHKNASLSEGEQNSFGQDCYSDTPPSQEGGDAYRSRSNDCYESEKNKEHYGCDIADTDVILTSSQGSGFIRPPTAQYSFHADDMIIISKTGIVSIQDEERVPTFGYIPLVIFGTVNFALSFGMPTSLSAFFLDWQESFQVSRASAATVHATCLGILNTGAIIPGFLMNRFGARPTLLAGSCMATLGLVLSAFASSITQLVFSVGVLGGMGFCMMNLPIIPSVTLPFTSYRSLIISCLSFGSSISNAGLTYLYRYMANQLSWRGAFFLLGGIALNSCVTGLVVTSFIKKPVSTAVSVEEEQFLSEGDIPEECDSGITLTSVSNQVDEQTILDEEQAKVSKPLDDDCPYYECTDDNSFQNKYPVRKDSKLQNSKFAFLLDPIYVLVVVNTAICIPSVGSLIYLLLDFAVIKGFTEESTGVLFLFIAFLFSAFGKLLSGGLNVIPRVQSVFIMIGFGFLGAISLIVLIYMDGFYEISVLLGLLGLSFGGLAGIYPKCVLDMHSVDTKSFPLALGIANTVEGLFDSSGPILMGFLVDKQGSYTLPLFLFSASCSLASTSLLVVYYLCHGKGKQ